ncbi:unnamed protein product [Pylaiella littoralis]
MSAKDETYCSIEQELWTPCSADCMQERYLDDACEKGAEVRACHVGNLCSMSKAGLLLSVGLTVSIDVRDNGVSEDHSDLWLSWVEAAVAEAVAQVAPVAAGNVEAAVRCADPRAADIAAIGGGAGETFECQAQVEMHLTPKVDNVAADKVSQVVNGTGGSPFAASLSSALRSAARRHWLLTGVAVTVVAAEKVSMFVASNREAYLPPEGNRLQSVKSGSGSSGGSGGGGFSSPEGAKLVLGLAGMVVAVIAALVFRVKYLRVPEEEGGEGWGRRPAGGEYLRVSSAARETEMPERSSFAPESASASDSISASASAFVSASRGMPLRLSHTPTSAAVVGVDLDSAEGGSSGGGGGGGSNSRSSVRRTVVVAIEDR